MLRRLLIVVVLIVLGVVAYQLLPAVGGVSAEALDQSVIEESGGAVALDERTCRRARGRTWLCDIGITAGNSGSTTYRVTKRSRRCWRARRVGGESDGHTPPRSLVGCVGLRHQGRLQERLGVVGNK